MGRSKQTATRSTGGVAPKNTVAYANWDKSSKVTEEGKPVAAPITVKYDGSYESAFYQHYFDTGVEREKWLAPSYRVATTLPPYTLPVSAGGSSSSNNNNNNAAASTEGTTDWIHLYFNSKHDGIGSQALRPNLHLVIALDVSGSMSEPFKGEAGKQKVVVAQHSLLTLMKQLKPEDSFGLVIFNSEATVIQPLTPWKDVPVEELQKKILALKGDGGTNISKALEAAKAMYTSAETERPGYSNRIMFLTDMEVTAEDGAQFKQSVLNNSNNNLWSTVVGVGLDLTQDLIKFVSKTAGCNYCNVRTTANFDELMNEEFSTTVFPIAFNIKISLVSTRYKIAAAYGSPEVSDTKPGSDVILSTEFPSVKNAKGETRSGVILFRVEDSKKGTKHEPFDMSVTWDDLSGIRNKDVQTLSFAHPPATSTTTTSTPAEGAPAVESAEEHTYFQNSGVRKAILLVRFTDFFRLYLELRAARLNDASLDLYLKMRHVYTEVVKYFRAEMQDLDDVSLSHELNALIDVAKLDDVPIGAASTTDSSSSSSSSSNNNNNNNNSTPTPAQLAARLDYLTVATERWIDEDDEDY